MLIAKLLISKFGFLIQFLSSKFCNSKVSLLSSSNSDSKVSQKPLCYTKPSDSRIGADLLRTVLLNKPGKIVLEFRSDQKRYPAGSTRFTVSYLQYLSGSWVQTHTNTICWRFILEKNENFWSLGSRKAFKMERQVETSDSEVILLVRRTITPKQRLQRDRL